MPSLFLTTFRRILRVAAVTVRKAIASLGCFTSVMQRGRFFYEMFPGAKASEELRQRDERITEAFAARHTGVDVNPGDGR